MSADAYFIWGIALIGFIGSTVILHKNRKDNGDVSKKGMKQFWLLLVALFIIMLAIVVLTGGN